MAGYPLGGDSLSITKGIVSRVVMTRYAHASNKLLGIQIDAAINPGNSGGPAFSDLQEVIHSSAKHHPYSARCFFLPDMGCAQYMWGVRLIHMQ